MRKEIMWLVSPLKFRYLRESIYKTLDPRRFPIKSRKVVENLELLVGYEVFIYDKGEPRPCGDKERRYWWLTAYDRDLHPEGLYKFSAPVNAIIPESITLYNNSQTYSSSEFALLDKNNYKHYLEHQDSLEYLAYNENKQRELERIRQVDNLMKQQLTSSIEDDRRYRQQVKLQKRLDTLRRKKGSFPNFDYYFKPAKQPTARIIIT